MSIIDWVILFVCILIPSLVILIAFIDALGKLPGWRRRKSSCVEYTGEERRCPARKKCPRGSVCMGPVECIYHPMFRDTQPVCDPDTIDRPAG